MTPASRPLPQPDGMAATYRKILLRLIPFLFVCYLFNYLDRVNVGFAKLQMLGDLGMSGPCTGWAQAPSSSATWPAGCRAT